MATDAEVHPGQHAGGVTGTTATWSTYGSRAWQTPVDSRQMQALVARCWRADWPATHLHAGDVDWWSVHALGKEPGLEYRIRLWFAGEPDATELVAFAGFGPPDDGDLIVDPGHRRTELVRPMVRSGGSARRARPPGSGRSRRTER